MIIVILITIKNIDSMITIKIMRKKTTGNDSVDLFTRIFEKTNFLKERNMLGMTIIINTIMIMIMMIMMMTKIVSINMLY